MCWTSDYSEKDSFLNALSSDIEPFFNKFRLHWLSQWSQMSRKGTVVSSCFRGFAAQSSYRQRW